MGKTLLEMGEVALGKRLLNESLNCAKIVSNSELMGRIHTLLSEVADLEGENQEAVQHLLLAHRLCKSTQNWQPIIILACKELTSIKKYEILKNFLGKVHLTVLELIEETGKEVKDKNTFITELTELRQLVLSSELAMLYLSFKELMEEDLSENRQCFSNAIKTLQTTTLQNPLFLNTHNFQFILMVLGEIITLYEEKGGSELRILGD